MNARSTQALILVVLIGCTVWLWSTLALYPIKLFVVLLHEISHGIAAIVTGGEVIEIEVNERIGGYCQYRGGNRLVVASAGYLGSLVWGGVILVIASRTPYSRQLGTVLAAVLLTVTLLWIRNSFGVFYTAGIAVVLYVLCRFLPGVLVRILMQFLGTASCLYVIVDIYEDVIRIYQDGSDADTLAQLTGIPAIFWGLIWGAIALVMIVYSFYLAARAPEEEETILEEEFAG